MLDTPTRANQQDFRQRYCTGFGYLLNNGKKTLVYIRDFRGDAVTFEDSDGHKYNAVSDSGVMFEFIPVTKGWYESEDTAAFICRVPAKQYVRAICHGNTQLTMAVADGPNKVYLGESNLTVQRVEGILEYKHNIQEALDAYVAKKKQFAVLSKHFAFINERLYFFNEVIGTVGSRGNGEVNIRLENDICRQELQDLFNRNNVQKVTIQ